jgi:excinuclease ABC subunit A
MCDLRSKKHLYTWSMFGLHFPNKIFGKICHNMEPSNIDIFGACEHNLKNINISVPKKKFVVFTGPSGSGKSSLAIDTIYVEGRRRFVESLSAYARQFLGQKEKPRFEKIHGLSPTIAVEQKSASTNPRSTVGTITEILDYLRVLYARLGHQHCPDCGQEVSRQSAQQIVNWIAALPLKTKVIVLSPIFQNRKGEHREILDQLRRQGLARARLNGEIFALGEKKTLNKRKKNTLEAVIDRLLVKEDMGARLADSVEAALKIGDGRLIVHIPGQGDTMLSERLACEACQRSFPDLAPSSFSFNSPQGMCLDCNGLGHKLEMDPHLIVPDQSKSVKDGAIKIWSSRHADNKSFTFGIIKGFADEHDIDLSLAWSKLSKKAQQLLLYGSAKKIAVKLSGRRFSGEYVTAFEGIIPMIQRRFLQTTSEAMKAFYSRFMSDNPCDSCQSMRLREDSRHVFIADHSLSDLCRHSVREVSDFFDDLAQNLEGEERVIGEELLKEVRARLSFLTNVGLDYLSLNRKGPTLSGGESQRIQLASQLGSELSGVVYVLDEPSIGLHARDALKLVDTLYNLRDQGNSVIVVEHDRDTIEAADWVVDFGPGAGRNGGLVTAEGCPSDLAANPDSLTGRYLSNELQIAVPKRRRKVSKSKAIKVKGARHNNLKNVTVSFPIGAFICVTGVSGAGKSTLVNQILLPAAAKALNKATRKSGDHDSIVGFEHLDKVIAINQQSIGRTPRSNPATYTKLWDQVRAFYAGLPESKAFGFKQGRFSFNVKGGRCESCQGSGVKKVEMHFLPDVYVVCMECQGKRFNEASLRVHYQGRSIADILDLSVDEAREVFRNHPKISAMLKTLDDVGLGYMALGQRSPTLSGGEAQRIKLAKELGRRQTGKTLYILDEPSTGLHFDDIRKLLSVLNRLVDSGNTIIVIEHNMDIIKTADWVIDIGPEGGDGGGRVVAEGSPERVARVKKSHTGRFLKDILKTRKLVGAKR